MQAVIGIAFLCTAVSASISQRIIGGSPTTINNYPSLVGYLRSFEGITFSQICGGSILNERTVLTAAHCDTGIGPSRYRIRVGSTQANSGGFVHNVARIIDHPNYNPRSFDNDIALLHIVTHIALSDVVQQATIAGSNFVVPDNAEIWVAGWGVMEGSVQPEQLRHIALESISQDDCRRFFSLSNNMLCAGSPNDQRAGLCTGDSGGPFYYRDIVVGVSSFTSFPCGSRPSVSARVSSYTNWILDNAYS